jgi:hypothetical protein
VIEPPEKSTGSDLPTRCHDASRSMMDVGDDQRWTSFGRK